MRALARLAHGADFLMERAVDDLSERLSTVGTQISKAAAVVLPDGRRYGRYIAGTRRAKSVSIVGLEAHERLARRRRLGNSLTRQLPLPPESSTSRLAAVAARGQRPSRHADPDPPGAAARRLFLAALAGGGTLAELRESLLAAETELTRRRGAAHPALHRRARRRRPAAARRLRPAGRRHRDDHGALRFDVRPDARPARHGRDQSAARRAVAPAGDAALFRRAAEIYAERFADPDGRVRATFSIVWLSGWAPDASQQKPLKPGIGKGRRWRISWATARTGL
jgi:hypothetical protein